MWVSMSDIAGFLHCRRQWDWGSSERRNLGSPRSSPAPALGTGVHWALEQFYNTGANPPSLADRFQTWVDTVGADTARVLSANDIDVALTVLDKYESWYGTSVKDDPDIAEMLVAEQQFKVHIPTTDGFLVGTADALFRDADGDLWLMDHKTYSYKPPNINTMVMMPQFVGYTWAFQMMSNQGALEHLGVARGELIQGLLYNGLHKPPKPSSTDNEPFLRAWVPHPRRDLVAFQSNLLGIYHDMSDPNLRIYPNPGDRGCDWCEFREPCLAAIQGEDSEVLLAQNFITKSPRGDVYTPAAQRKGTDSAALPSDL